MINKTIILLTTILLLTSCSVDRKIAKLFKEGHTPEQSFKTKIPFEYRLGLIIIKVELNNETYDFVLDSGGVNLLSKELAEKLGAKGVMTLNVGGLQEGKFQPMDFTKIKELSIGGIKFEETACGIGDFNQSVDLECIEFRIRIDGRVWNVRFSGIKSSNCWLCQVIGLERSRNDSERKIS